MSWALLDRELQIILDIHIPSSRVEGAPGDIHPGGMAEEVHGEAQCVL